MNTKVTPAGQPAAEDHEYVAESLREVASTLSRYVPNLEEREDGYSFEQGTVRVEVRGRALGVTTTKGHRLVGTLEAHTDLSDWAVDLETRGAKLLNHHMVALANIHTLVGAAIWRAQSDRLELLSRVPLIREDPGRHAWGPNLIALAALTQADLFVFSYSSLRNWPYEDNRTTNMLREYQIPDAWPGADFEDAAQRLSDIGYLADGSTGRLCAGFPWASPAGPMTPQAAPGTEKPLLAMFGAEVIPHPLLGPGMLMRLELPVAYDLRTGMRIANDLNEMEVQTLDNPPLCGAWALHTTSMRITYVTFLPYRAYHPDLLARFAFWAGGRVSRAQEWFANGLTGTTGQLSANTKSLPDRDHIG